MLKHIAIGLFIPYCIFLFIYVRNGFRFKSKVLARVPYVLLFCAIWSIVPNILKWLPFYIRDIFFFHGILSRLRTTGSTWGLGMIFFVFFSLFFIFVRHLGAQEKAILDLEKGAK